MRRAALDGLLVKGGIVIPEAELKESFIRASGPGGQNVNKVASAVQLRFDVGSSPSLPEPVRTVLLKTARLTREGVLVITARRFREQERNRADARDRLAETIRRAAAPRKVRRPTKAPKASKQRRLDHKKHRAALKRDRARPGN
jgi:ribosome-associated protein